jgi:hypothetical protein
MYLVVSSLINDKKQRMKMEKKTEFKELGNLIKTYKNSKDNLKEKIMKRLVSDIDLLSCENEIINEFKKRKQEIIYKSITNNVAQINKGIEEKIDYLKRNQIEIKITEKEIKEYLQNKLNTFYKQIIRNAKLDCDEMKKILEKTGDYQIKKADMCNEFNGLDKFGNWHPGFSGSNGGPIGRLEKIAE